MVAALLVIGLVAFPLTGVHIFLYLRSTFALLELVQQDPALWKSLGEPRKTWVREPMPGGFNTIQPIGPWLAWVWTAQPGSSVQPELADCLRRTSRLLKRGLVLFGIVMLTVALLALSAK